MHLIFDLDGTLFQARDITLFAANAVFEELGITGADDRQIVENIGRPMDVFLKNILPKNITPDEVRDRFRGYEHQAIRERGLLFPGIMELLRHLSVNGYVLSICSNGSFEYIELVLNLTCIREYFTGVYTARHHESKAQFVAELLMPDDHAVYIGDSFDDIEAGYQNSIPTIAALYGYGNKDYLKQATFAVSAPEEIIGCIHQLDVFAQITQRLIAKGSRIIGISGIDTSGKTRFSQSYARYLDHLGYKTAIIHLDDFHNPLIVRRSGDNEIDAYYEHAFNYAQLIREVLEPLKRQGNIDKDILCLNVDTDRYENTVHYEINSETVVLLEGVLLFRPPVLTYLEGKVFLEIDFTEMLKRARLRDVPKYGEAFMKKYTDKYIPVQKRYLDEYKPRFTCDLVVDNNDYLHPMII